MLPDFIGVGPGRAGTTWVYEVLNEHPEICLAKNVKECEYFDLNYYKGWDWYKGFFSYCKQDQIKGEITNRYIFSEKALERICECFENVKILIFLRNPYERLVSNYIFKIREGSDFNNFKEALFNNKQWIEENKYYSLSEPLVSCLGQDKIFFVMYDEISTRPKWLAKEIYKFLGVKDNFDSYEAEKVINASITPRFKGVGLASKKIARLLRVLGAYKMLTFLKRSEKVKSILFKREKYNYGDFYDKETFEFVHNEIHDELLKLSNITGKNLTRWEEWKK